MKDPFMPQVAKTDIIPNHNCDLFTPSLVCEEDRVGVPPEQCLLFTPVVAWAVAHFKGEYNDGRFTAVPVTPDEQERLSPVVVNRSTGEWLDPYMASGGTLESLYKYLVDEEFENKHRRMKQAKDNLAKP